MRTPVSDPAERTPVDLPGAGDPGPSNDPDAELPKRLAERIDDKAGGIAAGEPDLLPNVEVPEESM